jgi:hypothetical protein
MSTRDAVIEMIRKMPENVSVPDIIAELYFRQKVDEGLQQLDANEGVPHGEATKRLDKWLA